MGYRGERVPQEDHQGDQLRRAATFCMLLFLIGLALADQNSAFHDGKGFGAAKNQGIFDSINTGTASDKIPAYGATPAETQYYQGGKGQLTGPGIGKMQSCGSYTPGSDKIANQECEAVNFLARNPQVRPQFNITKNDPMIIRAKNARNSAESFFQAIGIEGGAGSSSQCTTRTETTPAQYNTETCSSAKEIGTQQCTMGRVINIDTDANFQCEQTINAYETIKCRRTNSLICTGGGDGCDQGGIVPNSWAGDMSTTWFPDGAGNYILQFGTIADNYWGGWGAVYDRNLTFDIRDVGLITRFALTRAAFDDWLMVKVNGNLVYVGPRGGDRLEITQAPTNAIPSNGWCYQNEWGGGYSCYVPYGWESYRLYGNYGYCERRGGDGDGNGGTWYCGSTAPGYVQYCPTCFGSPELGTSWNIGLNIDLRPHLTAGSNTIFMRTIVAGGGEGAIQLTTRQVCPLNCSVLTDNQCAALQARAQ